MNDKELPARTTAWRGYSLDELRYARMVTLARIEIEKAKLYDCAAQTRADLPFIGSNSSMTAVLRSISILEYFIIAFKLFRRLAPLFRKKKA